MHWIRGCGNEMKYTDPFTFVYRVMLRFRLPCIFCNMQYINIIRNAFSRRLRSLCALLLAPLALHAQAIFISQPEKISTDLLGYDILGKTRNGEVLVYKKYRYADEIEIYDKQMDLKRKKDISIKNVDNESVEVMKMGEDLYHFYTYKDNKTNFLMLQRYNSEIEKKGDPMLIDSTSARMGDNFSEFKISTSPGNTYFLIYKYEFAGGRIDKLFSIVVNDDGKVVQNNSINLPDSYSSTLIKEEISDEGHPVFLFQNSDFSCKRDKDGAQYVFYFPQPGNVYAKNEIVNGDYCLDQMEYEIDMLSGRIVMLCFLKEDDKNFMVGYNFSTISISSGETVTETENLFTSEQIVQIAGNTGGKEVHDIPVYQIGTVLPRMDGGALMVAEYYNKSVENYEYTNFDPYYGYRTSTRQVEFYEYDDILLMSLDPQGNISWMNVIPKKQVSREDRGVNSSYALVNAKQRAYFIFNENIDENSNVMQYALDADGSLDRKSLFNASQQEVQLRPASGKQVAFNEMVIPSIYKKSLAFVKLAF